MAEMEMSKSTAKKLKQLSEHLQMPAIKLIEGLVEEIYAQEIEVPAINHMVESRKQGNVQRSNGDTDGK